MAHDAREGILIIGAPRSGTTLLRRLLNAHPSIHCPGETGLFSAGARFLQHQKLAEAEVGVVSGLGFAGFTPDEVRGRLREFLFSFHREIARRAGARRWAEKTVWDAFHLDAIEEICGAQADFVCVVRHGLDVACSTQELVERNQGYVSELHEYVKRHPRPLEAFAHAWVDTARSILAFVARRAENALLTRYEDLVGDPEQEMRRIPEFLGEAFEPALLESALARHDDLGQGDWKTYRKRSIDQESVGRWRKLPRNVVSELGRIVNPTLESLGYAAVPVGPEPTREQETQRQKLAVMVQRMSGGGEGSRGD
jgi:hypothetical protein